MSGEQRQRVALMVTLPRRRLWVPMVVLILVLDYLTGPVVEFPILYVLPVALATWRDGWKWGALLAVLLPSVRLGFALAWEAPIPIGLLVLDEVVDVAVLALFVVLVEQMRRQRRELRVLEGMLPICGFCKRVRTGSAADPAQAEWQQLESFISANSQAQFSHTFCPDCGRQHYGRYFTEPERPT